MRIRKIYLFGGFGSTNLGNNVTLQTMLENARRYLPGAKISCICWDPEQVKKDLQIHAVPISRMPHRKSWHQKENLLPRVLGKILNRALMEPLLWIKAYRDLQGTDLLVMTGTGMLSDAGLGPFRMPYDLFKWSIVAKLCGTKLLFVSVGAGPIYHSLSKWFIKIALELADYRSYRDKFSKEYIQNIGFNTNHDQIYPDLVFSMPKCRLPELEEDIYRCQPIIGIGLMAYYGSRNMPREGEAIYQAYIAKIATFVSWLLERGYSVRLTIGQSEDARAVQDIQEILNQPKISYNNNQLIAEPILSIDDLLRQLADTEIVVATRFHNLILAIMLNKPVISVSYNEKCNVLLAEMGLEKFAQPADDLNVNKLITQFCELEKNRNHIISKIKKNNEQFRKALEKQYDYIFGSF